ncbi:uncharacterized protein LOC128722861 [Anopheles nili]|uniref:uncharacterized protein LOC128722861 n=1 Tax=Anopheles nili TaxID=185578 RepID=UPI00237A0DFB|nr:uncharacterized protein LOC128722861 [Anopheles nili]
MTTVEELCENFTKIGLIRECEKLGLPTNGGKWEIAEKIINQRSKMGSNGEDGDVLEGEKDDDRCPEDDGVCEKDGSQHSGIDEHDDDGNPSNHDEDDDEDDDIEEEDEEDSDVMYRTAMKVSSTPKISRDTSKRLKVYSFRDMEESIESFGAEEGEDVRMWLMQLKSVCKAARWDKEQQLIMCRKKLTGTARRFMFSLRSSFNSFEKLEKALIKEFAPRIRAGDVHRALTNRKKRSTETIRDYIYDMQRLALPIDLDEPSLCEYIVSGITDDKYYQSSLLEAQTIERLKKKLATFEKVTKTAEDKTKREELSYKKQPVMRNSKVARFPVVRTEATTAASIPGKHCYNCGERGHQVQTCPNKAQGPKCFACSSFGHRATECPHRNVSRTNMVVDNTGMVETIINSTKLQALFDSGSQQNLITRTGYHRICEPPLTHTTMQFCGFGGVKTKAIGCFATALTIDNTTYSEVKFFLVPDESMPYHLVLGRDCLNIFEVKITSSGIEVIPRECTSEVLLIQCDNGQEIDAPLKYVESIQKLIDNYSPTTQMNSKVETKIILYDDTPVRSSPRRFAPGEKAVLEKTMDEWLAAGIIKESESDYASPVTLARKKDGTLRVCVDYRELNRKMVKDCFPMRNIEDQIDRLKSANVFTTLDLKNSFFHVPVETSSQRYTGFVTHAGQYEFLRTPFGLANSPASFGRFVADVFRDLIKHGSILVYVDDLIIPSSDVETNLQTLRELLKVAGENGVQFNWKKSQFLKTEVEYLGLYSAHRRILNALRKVRGTASSLADTRYYYYYSCKNAPECPPAPRKGCETARGGVSTRLLSPTMRQ